MGKPQQSCMERKGAAIGDLLAKLLFIRKSEQRSCGGRSIFSNLKYQ
jgi:hypothetical protein